jgi:NitT/TauT family transport system substrate-binding protein
MNMTLTRRHKAAVAVLPLLLGVLAGCGDDPDSNAAPAAPDTTTEELAPLSPPVDVTIGSVGSIPDAGLFVAVEEGYFEELGLNVELKQFQNLGQLAAPLAANQIDVGGGGIGPGLWNAAGRGLETKAVATKGAVKEGYGYSAFLVKKGSSIESCEDARGKSVAFAAPSNAGVHTGAVWLEGCGLTFDDVEVKTMPFSEMAGALNSGAIDIAHLIEPLVTIAIKQGIATLLINDAEIQETQQGVLQFSPEFAANEAAARRFMVAYAQGIADYNDNWPSDGKPAPELVDILTKHTSVKDGDLLASTVPAFLAPYGELNMDAAQSHYEFFKSRDEIEGDVPFEAVWDTSFVEFAREYLETNPG